MLWLSGGTPIRTGDLQEFTQCRWVGSLKSCTLQYLGNPVKLELSQASHMQIMCPNPYNISQSPCTYQWDVVPDIVWLHSYGKLPSLFVPLHAGKVSWKQFIKHTQKFPGLCIHLSFATITTSLDLALSVLDTPHQQAIIPMYRSSPGFQG